MNKSFIKLKSISKSYALENSDVKILDDINLNINKGEFVGILGKSGSGKSTLLNMVTGIDRPTTGEVWVNDKPIHNLSESKMALWRGNNVGVVFQFFQLLPMLTLLENVMLPMDFCNKYAKDSRKDRALELLKSVELVEHAHKLPSKVSGGEQQRAAIARAMANNPGIIVADEPTGNLDSKTGKVIIDLFSRLLDEDKTILMVTHDESLSHIFTKNIFMADGMIQVNERKKNPVLVN